MNDKLNKRMNELSNVLQNKSDCLALLALGSCAELDRQDEWSDLDFFVIVEEGKQRNYLENLEWLEACAPLAFSFRNTIDGHKIMWNDGAYAEYAVFEMNMLPRIPFTTGMFMFKKEGVELSESSSIPMPNLHQDIDYAVNEILTNLYVGLSRYHRGEILSAFRLIQVHAIDHVLSMADKLYTPKLENEDVFALNRRAELRHPELCTLFTHSLLGYSHVPHSAKVILEYLKSITNPNQMMVNEIERLINLTK
jgi:lincosamide nucleotidyltransferase B/F